MVFSKSSAKSSVQQKGRPMAALSRVRSTTKRFKIRDLKILVLYAAFAVHMTVLNFFLACFTNSSNLNVKVELLSS